MLLLSFLCVFVVFVQRRCGCCLLHVVVVPSLSSDVVVFVRRQNTGLPITSNLRPKHLCWLLYFKIVRPPRVSDGIVVVWCRCLPSTSKRSALLSLVVTVRHGRPYADCCITPPRVSLSSLLTSSLLFFVVILWCHRHRSTSSSLFDVVVVVRGHRHCSTSSSLDVVVVQIITPPPESRHRGHRHRHRHRHCHCRCCLSSSSFKIVIIIRCCRLCRSKLYVIWGIFVCSQAELGEFRQNSGGIPAEFWRNSGRIPAKSAGTLPDSLRITARLKYSGKGMWCAGIPAKQVKS